MSWRVESRIVPGRWVDHDGETWTADGETASVMQGIVRSPQPLTPTGPWYEPEGDDDSVAVFLCALALLPAPVVSGDPPPLPSSDTGDDPNPNHVY
jgi:hypothetical protein